jgi:nicotinamidase-related amidase
MNNCLFGTTAANNVFLAEYYVKQTAIHALNLGYKVFLVEDCIATGDDVQYRKQQAFAELKDKGAIIIQRKELYLGANQNSS